jgi:ADP-ribosyl-[dinitrogen reductase] hydrolase
MLIECAIADAYGAGFEYVRDRRFISRNNTLAGYVQHPRHKLRPGTYTDDTQMSIAVAELIIEGGQWSAERIAEKFISAFQRDRREGYAGGFFAFLNKTKTGPQFLENIRNTSDKGRAHRRLLQP